MKVGMLKVGSRTPWGKCDNVIEYPNGIVFCSTPSHGGYHVPASLHKRIPEAYRTYAKSWSGSASWYEEDVAAMAVHIHFPEIFPNQNDEQRAGYKISLDKYALKA